MFIKTYKMITVWVNHKDITGTIIVLAEKSFVTLKSHEKTIEWKYNRTIRQMPHLRNKTWNGSSNENYTYFAGGTRVILVETTMVFIVIRSVLQDCADKTLIYRI
jgi:hypothetical protein